MFSYTFMQNAFLIALCISILCPCIGIFLVLRRYSMIGDTLAHASLAGIAISLLLNRNPVLGAFIFTALCGAATEFLRTYFQKYADLILTIILSLSVGTAITIISSGRLHANIDSYLFGSILTVTRTDMITVSALTVFSAAALIFFYHQLLYITYDEEAARIAHVPVKWINYIFAVLVAAAISVSIRIVGVLVLSSMIALPVAAALQLQKGFRQTLFYSVIFSIFDMMTGLFASYYAGVAPGGLTALIAVFVLTLVMMMRKVQQKTALHKKTTFNK